jgi:hypothetical protein
MMAEEKDSKSESKGGQAEDEWQFNQEQYDRLIECSKKGLEGIEEWNEWRAKNPVEMIWLEGAELDNANLQEANLCLANLKGAELSFANLQGVNLQRAKLEGAKLSGANLEGAKLLFANLQVADLNLANLQKAKLRNSNLQGADLSEAELQGAGLVGAKLEGAYLWGAKLERAGFFYANLQGAEFEGVIVDGATSFLGCRIDKNTDFRHTGLENVCIEAGTKVLLKYNVRRMNWEDWYGKHRFLQWLVRAFWWVSDYGISTGRIMLTFFLLALVFANIYYCWGAVDYYVLGEKDNPGVVSNLFVVDGEVVAWWLVPLRAVYFSIVTMTTLGFGDMFANAKSVYGHLLLMLQVLLGYVLLGALITRFAVLFTSDGPAGSYTPMGEETKALLGKLKDKEKAG